MAEFVLSKQTSFPRLRTTLALHWNRLTFTFGSSQSAFLVLVLSGLKLDCPLRNFLETFSNPTSSNVMEIFRMLHMSLSSSGGVLRLKKHQGLVKIIRPHEVVQKSSNSSYNFLQFSLVAFIKNKESSAKNMWAITGPLRFSLIPCTKLRIVANADISRKNLTN